MLLNPEFWLVLIITWIVTAFGGYEYAQKEIEAEKAEASAQLAAANEKAVQVTQEWQAKQSKTVTELQKVQNELDQSNHKLNMRLASGTVRLSVAGSCSGEVPHDSTVATDYKQGRCDIDPAAAERIVAITERGDRAIEKLNACVDLYNGLNGGGME